MANSPVICSTLDLLKRVPNEAGTAESADYLSSASDGSHSISSPTKVFVAAHVHEITPTRNRHYDTCLNTSHSTPALHSQTGESLSDALDEAVKTNCRSIDKTRKSATGDRSDTARLKEQRQQLEETLLKLTRKLNRKYSRQLFPPTTMKPDEVQLKAERWREADTLSEGERHTMYMKSRFTTQQQLDYYPRELEPREPETDHHHHNTAHTKYADAFAHSSTTLRGRF